MRITHTFFYLFIFQVILMSISLTYDAKVIDVVAMVLYVSLLLVLGSFVGEKYSRTKSGEVSSHHLKMVLLGSLYFSVIFFLVKLYINFENIDFTSYYTIRGSFLMLSDDAAAIFMQMSLWVGLITAGNLLARKTEKDEGVAQYVYIALAIFLAVFFTGGRSVILLFAVSYLAGAKSLFEAFITKKTLYMLVSVVLFLLILGYLRDISLNHMLTPFDSFVVGPHLLNHNMTTIIEQREHLGSGLNKPLGYALFSGFYVGMNIILSYLDIEVFKYHLEAVFWERHKFDYVPAFDNQYNSYYTVGLAVVVEGWLRVGVMVFLMGLVPHFIRNSYAKMILITILYFFAFSLFKLSVFQNFALGLLFVFVIFYEALNRFYRLYVKNY